MASTRLNRGGNFLEKHGAIMTALLIDSRELKLLAEFTGSGATVTGSSAAVPPRGADAVCTTKTVRVRAETVTPVLKRMLELRPPSHWGINE
jgi:hypothetical protein